MNVTTCRYCDQPAVTSSLVNVGEAPADPKYRCTKLDHRRVVIVRACPTHVGKLGRP